MQVLISMPYSAQDKEIMYDALCTWNFFTLYSTVQNLSYLFLSLPESISAAYLNDSVLMEEQNR